MKMGYLFLVLAIIAEVVATNALKASDGFTRLGPSALVIIGYGVAFYCLSLVIAVIPVGIAYAIWSGVGVVLISVVAAILFKQVPDLPAVIGMVLIVSGVIVIQVFSNTGQH